jgi:threonine dehydratase
MPSAIVMPWHTSFSKVPHTQAHGAQVILEGEVLFESTDVAEALHAKEGLTFIHPYDDDRIITGQGTVALVMLADHPDLECLVVPIGGGLIAGCDIAAKALDPDIKNVVVEAAVYLSMTEMFAGAAPTSGGQTIGEGIAVKRPGGHTKPIVEALVSEIIAVDVAALERAVLMLLEIEKAVVEGAGALAAVLDNPARFAGRKHDLVVSGGNIDTRIVASILMRGLVRERRLLRLRDNFSEALSALAWVSGIVGAVGRNIVEVYHQRLFHDVPVKLAELDIVVKTRDEGHAREIVTRLESDSFRTRMMQDTARGCG